MCYYIIVEMCGVIGENLILFVSFKTVYVRVKSLKMKSSK